MISRTLGAADDITARSLLPHGSSHPPKSSTPSNRILTVKCDEESGPGLDKTAEFQSWMRTLVGKPDFHNALQISSTAGIVFQGSCHMKSAPHTTGLAFDLQTHGTHEAGPCRVNCGGIIEIGPPVYAHVWDETTRLTLFWGYIN